MQKCCFWPHKYRDFLLSLFIITSNRISLCFGLTKRDSERHHHGLGWKEKKKPLNPSYNVNKSEKNYTVRHISCQTVLVCTLLMLLDTFGLYCATI